MKASIILKEKKGVEEIILSYLIYHEKYKRKSNIIKIN